MPSGHALSQQPCLDAFEAQRASQVIREALRSAWLSDLSSNLLERQVGQQVDQDFGMAVQTDYLANRGGCRVDQATLDARLGDHAFATAIEVAKT